MLQVVLFSSDFNKESSELIIKEIKKIDELAAQHASQSSEDLFSANFKNPYIAIQVDISEPYIKFEEILERHRGLALGLPEEWFHFEDRLKVHILQKNIKVTGPVKSLLLMPAGGTPVRIVANDDYTTNQTLTAYFFTNINYGNQENVLEFEQQCDQKVVQILSNVNLLNAEIDTFSGTYRQEISKKIAEVRTKAGERIES